ncbi:hypothetical protein B0H10DRAFT_2228364 [Mycena sp. CBHHK59/15]|nr:hypothetical protein B0H10DRAFT_2228364 [Mycena sp. CBHHK59/15]
MPLKCKHIIARLNNIAHRAIERLSPRKKKRKINDDGSEKENTAPRPSTPRLDVSHDSIASENDRVASDSNNNFLSDLPSIGASPFHTGHFPHMSSPAIPSESAPGQFNLFRLPPPPPRRRATVEEVPDQDDISDSDARDFDADPLPQSALPNPGVHACRTSNLPTPEVNLDLDGKLREAPKLALAVEALADLKILLHLKHLSGKGYIDPKIDPFVRLRMEAMQSLLNLYTNEKSKTYGHWRDSSVQVAITQNKGPYWARQTRCLMRQFIQDHTVLPLNPYGYWKSSMLVDKELKSEVNLHLQELGKEITAQKLGEFLCHADVMEQHGISKKISLRTAQCYFVKK